MKVIERFSRKGATAAAVLPVALLMGFGGLASTAAAAPEQVNAPTSESTPRSCSHSHSNKDSYEGLVDADWLNRRMGPHSYCGSYGMEKRNTLIYYHCFTETKYNGTWTWGRVAGTNRQGWFSDTYLNNGGSNRRC